MNKKTTFVEKLAEELNVQEEELVSDMRNQIENLVPEFYMSEENFYLTINKAIMSLEAHKEYTTSGEKTSPTKIKNTIIKNICLICRVLGPKLDKPISIGF